MPYIVYVYFSFSIAIAAITGGVRFNKIDPAYFPFIFYLWLATANEIVTFVLSTRHITTNLSNNIYVLPEAWLLVWQAKRWNAIQSKNVYLFLQVAVTIGWLVEVFVSNGLYDLHSVFRILTAALYLVIFIGYSNRLIFQYDRPVIKDAGFLISIGLVFFYSFKILVEVYWWQGVDASDKYLYGLFNVIVFINLLVNLLYIIAVLWIPTKAKFTTFS